MALVAYDFSSDEEEEEGKEQDTQLSGTCILTLPTTSSQPKEDSNENMPLFSSLPSPVKFTEENIVEEEEYDEFLHKKELTVEKPPRRIQIDVPSLSGYSSDEDDEPPDKRIKKSVSGLFSILPAPKFTPLSNTSFVPNVVKKKAKQPLQKKPTKSQNKEPAPVPLSNGYYHSDSNDEDDIEIPEIFDDETWQKVCGKKIKPEVRPSPELTAIPEQENLSVISAPEVEQPYSGLDNQAFKELVGSSKRIPENIKLIDIHEDAIRPDKELWLKSLTDPDFEADLTVENPVDNTRKCKNHITSLAQKALENDKELQRTWSENRFNRKQTQAKYGF